MKGALTVRASRDLREIWNNIARHHPRAADRLIDALFARTRILQDFPLVGAPRPEVGRGARLLALSPHVILHLPENQQVRVVRVVHGARDITPDLLR